MTAAWGWCAGATGFWAGAWVLDILFETLNHGLADRLWVMAAILMLCPPIAVLGSRRPTVRAWPWFVLLPLILVLAIPVISTWRNLFAPAPLRLEAPMLIGLGLVLAMGAGNYLGSRFTLPAVLFVVAVLLLIAPVTAALSDALARPQALRGWATVVLSSAALLAGQRAKASAPPICTNRPQLMAPSRLWMDFRDWFGIVWARRVQDRVNEVAERQQWPVRLELGGFKWTGDVPAADEFDQTSMRIDDTLRWLLGRFVDPVWIDARLGSQSAAPPSRASEKLETGQSRDPQQSDAQHRR